MNPTIEYANVVQWTIESKALYAVARRWGIPTKGVPFREVERLVHRLPKPKSIRK